MVAAASHNVGLTMGATLLGSLFSLFLSGVVTMQAIMYYRTFPHDHLRFKLLVGIIWSLDILHSCLVCGADWFYLVHNFGNFDAPDSIPWEVSITIAITALLTLIVHGFFAHRIFTLSKRNYFVTVPIVVLAVCRLGAAMVTTSESIRLKNYVTFAAKFNWAFTMGLTLAASVDVLVTCALGYYLHRSRTGFASMDGIINSITLYTIENGALTCLAAIASLTCWLTLHHTLVWLGFHFAISKLYANAFLATLNARKVLRGRSHGSDGGGYDNGVSILIRDPSIRRGFHFPGNSDPIETKVSVNVEKFVHREGSGVELSDRPRSPSSDSSQVERSDTKDTGLSFSLPV